MWDKFTVDEHLDLIGEIKGFKPAFMECQKQLYKQLLNLGGFSGRQARYLSGGNKRKLCNAMAMIGDSSVLMFDEPSEGVDPITRKRLYSYLRNMENQSVLLITQRIDEAESICDSILMLMKGRVRDQGAPGRLK